MMAETNFDMENRRSRMTVRQTRLISQAAIAAPSHHKVPVVEGRRFHLEQHLPRSGFRVRPFGLPDMLQIPVRADFHHLQGRRTFQSGRPASSASPAPVMRMTSSACDSSGIAPPAASLPKSRGA